MFFPWVGLFEQVRLADEFVHYSDVQLPQGRSFMSRVQIKTAEGPQWLSVPVHREGRLIGQVLLDEAQPWRQRHLRTLRHAYARSPHVHEMLDLVEGLYAQPLRTLAELNCAATERIAGHLGLSCSFGDSTGRHSDLRSSERLLRLVIDLGGNEYVTGLGALEYLDHELFEQHGVTVRYMRYEKRPYPQLHGEFNPFVSILDLIANCGREGASVIASGTVSWKEVVR